MRRKKAKPHIEVKCDYCGSMTDRFVVNMEHKRFCRHQHVGFTAERDCMADYIEEKKNGQKKEKEKGVYTQEKVCIQKEEIKNTEKDKANRTQEEEKHIIDKKKQQKNEKWNKTKENEDMKKK